MKKLALQLVCVITVSMMCIGTAGAVQYTIQDVGTVPGYSYYFSRGINDRGEVVGYMSSGVAFAWDALSGIRQIGAGGAAYGLNNNGVAVLSGGSSTYLWDKESGSRRIAGFNGRCINDLGHVAGESYFWDEVNGVRGIVSAYYSAHAINNLDQVAGHVDGSPARGFIWDSVNGATDLGCLADYVGCYAYGINDLGQVVGDCRSQDQSVRRAFIWDPVGGIQDLGITGGATDINNAGQIVGGASGGNAFVGDRFGNVQYLPRLVAGKAVGATRISENGLIAGIATASDGTQHAVIWTPVPEPSGLLALLAGAASLGVIARRR